MFHGCLTDFTFGQHTDAFFCALQSRFVSITNLFVPNEDGKKSQVIKYSFEKK